MTDEQRILEIAAVLTSYAEKKGWDTDDFLDACVLAFEATMKMNGYDPVSFYRYAIEFHTMPETVGSA